MIIQMLIDFLTNVISVILNIVTSIFPVANIGTEMMEMLAKILTITTQANNFIHFILGDFVIVIVPLAIGLVAYKYIGYPIITLIRSIFVNGNN